MLEKIFKFFKWIILPILISILIISVLSLILKLREQAINNIVGILICIILIYYLFIFVYALFIRPNKRKDDNSLYEWLDTLGGSESLLESLFLGIEKKNEVLINLELVYNKINVLTAFEMKKLKLLRAYFRTLNEEGPHHFYNRTVLGIASPLAVIGISKGLIKYLNQSIFLFWGLTIIVSIIGVIILVYVILEHFKNKKRNKIMLEILDVCIEEINSLNT